MSIPEGSIDVPGFGIFSRRPKSAIPRRGIAGESSADRPWTWEGAMEAEDRSSVTIWIYAVLVGDPDAARQLWQRYFESLVRLPWSKLRSTAKVAADEEDLALSAFDSFDDGMTRGRFPDLANRDDRWRLPVTIPARNAPDQNRRESRQKRGGGRVLYESALGAARSLRWTA
jgi:hypothetical protein